MTFTLIFSEKPKTANKQKAIELISNIQHVQKDGKFIVTSNNLTHQFKKCISLASGWGTSELLIDGKEVDFKELGEILGCARQQSCKGFCYPYFRRPYYCVAVAIDNGSHPGNVIEDLEYYPFFKHVGNDKWIVNKTELNHYFNKFSRLLQFCDSFNPDTTLKKMGEIPDQFRIRKSSYDDNEDDFIEHPPSGDIFEYIIRKQSVCDYPIDYLIQNSIILTCNFKRARKNIQLKIKLNSFDFVTITDVEPIEPKYNFMENGILYFLECEILNLSKFPINFNDIRYSFVIANKENYLYNIYYNYYFFETTKFGEKNKLKGIEDKHFQPKIKKNLILPIFLPNEKNQQYKLGILGGEFLETAPNINQKLNFF